jgi:pimeloyl-ACP methyl ester carboxylesterase
MTETNLLDDTGKGTPMVFLHGFPFNRSMWREQIEFLNAQGFRCVAPDLRGMGENSTPASVAPALAGESATEDHRLKSVPLHRMEDMARDVAALMDELKIDRAAICGLSMGGYVAFDFFHLFPEKVSALILAGTRAQADNEQEKAGREQQAQTLLRAGMVPISIATMPKLLAPKTLSEKRDVVKRVREMITGSNPAGAAAAQRGMAVRRDYVDDLAKINVPALIIVGREDSIRPVSDARFMHERIAGSQLVVIDDAAHLSNLEQPEAFNEAIHSLIR